MSPQQTTVILLALLTVGLIAICVAVVRWITWVPPFEQTVPAPDMEEPRMNEGGGWVQPDGRITMERDGLGPDLRGR